MANRPSAKPLFIIKGTVTTKKISERRKKVLKLIGMGVKEIDIASQLGVSLSCIEKDVREIFVPEDPALAQKKLNEEINWDLMEATKNYLKATDHTERVDWLRTRGRILYTKAISLKNNLIIQQNNFTQNNVSVNVIQQLKELQTNSEKPRETDESPSG